MFQEMRNSAQFPILIPAPGTHNNQDSNGFCPIQLLCHNPETALQSCFSIHKYEVISPTLYQTKVSAQEKFWYLKKFEKPYNKVPKSKKETLSHE